FRREYETQPGTLTTHALELLADPDNLPFILAGELGGPALALARELAPAAREALTAARRAAGTTARDLGEAAQRAGVRAGESAQVGDRVTFVPHEAGAEPVSGELVL